MKKHLEKIFVSFIVSVLFGILYAYEHPKHIYTMRMNGKTKEIKYEDYQWLKKENDKTDTEYYTYTPISRENSMDIYKILLSGGLIFIGMILLLNLLEAIEDGARKPKL